MIVKKYTAATETEAVLKAREDLGAGAVVLNVKVIKQRGLARLFKKDYVELTAALEEKELAQTVNEKKPTAMQSSVPQTEHFNAVVDNDNSIEKKLDSLHNLLKDQINKNAEVQAPKPEPEPVKAQEAAAQTPEKENSSNFKFLKLIYNKLLDSEVNEKLANIIIDEIDSSLKKESNIDSIISAVYQKIVLKLGEPSLISEENGLNVIFFMGPTGVGKTTTIAKLASAFKLNKKRKVAMITADTYRIAAVEQLNTYAGIMDVPVTVIYSPSELVDAIKEYQDYDMIFVDTAGRSHRNSEQLAELEDMYKLLEEAEMDIRTEKYLVLSATTKYRDLVNIAEAYKNISEYKLLFTKLDETSAYGNILNLRHITGASLSYTTCGQNVPNDIEPTDVQGLSKHLISGAGAR